MTNVIVEAEMVAVVKVEEGVGTRINFTEPVAEARVQRVLAEEEEILLSDNKVKQLKFATMQKLAKMSNAPDEETRREIRNEIVVDNMRLVTQVLKKYGFFNADKFQNGCVGLLKAADTYLLDKGVPFHNYAAFCIEREIRAVFKKQNNSFEAKAASYLDSLDAPTELGNGDVQDRHETVYDMLAEGELDDFLAEAEVDTLFYNIIIPCINQYGTRSNGMNMELWRDLEIKYFMGMAEETSQQQRLTFTAMAVQLNSTPQNLRLRHKKVIAAVRAELIKHGYSI
jgi:hypothetical protein